MRKFLAPLVQGVNEYATHSMRSGGASNAGFKSADPELKDRHAGWKIPITKLRYQKRSTEELMEITKWMSVWFEFHCLLVFISSSAGERELRLGPVQISSLSLAAIYGVFFWPPWCTLNCQWARCLASCYGVSLSNFYVIIQKILFS